MTFADIIYAASLLGMLVSGAILVFKERLDMFDRILLVCLCIMLPLVFAGVGFSQSKLPGTDATMTDVRAMINECEVDLPRSQNCVVDIMVRPEQK